MPSKEEIEEVLIDNELALKIHRVFETMNKEQKTNGELSQFNKDVCEIFEALINRQPHENITATEVAIKQQNMYIQMKKEEYFKNKIEQLEAENKEVTEKEKKALKFLLELKKDLTEELKYNSTKRNARLQLIIVDVILEILKGEKN